MPGCDENNKELKSLSTADCASWFEKRDFGDWPDYDSFIQHSRKMRVVKVNKENYKMSECSCPTWCKYYKCKHMIDLCSRLGLFNYDARVKSIPIGANRRRGNPGKTKGAFIFQPSDEVNQAVYSASDSENELKEAPKKKGAKPKKAEHSSESEDSDYDLFETTPKATTSKKTAPLQRKAKSKIVENKEKTQKPETSKKSTTTLSKKKKTSFAPRK